MANKIIIANREIVLREEFDDWAILFNPDNGEGFGINPIGVYIWKQLNGTNTVSDIITKLKENCQGVPEDAENYVNKYLDSLVKKGLAGEKL